MKRYCPFCETEYEFKNKQSTSNHLRACKAYKDYKQNVLTKEYLEEEYIKKGRSAIEIANEHNLGSAVAIIKLLKKYDIQTRNISESKNEREREKRIKTNLSKYGYEHPFSKNHPSRKEWEKRLFEEEGITNVFQRKEIIETIRTKSLETKYKLGLAIRPDILSEYTLYCRQVQKLTEKTYKDNMKEIDPDQKREWLKYELDHIYSKHDGFKNNIPPEILAHSANLQILTKSENVSKSSRSDIDINELYRRIEEYEFCESKKNKEAR